VKPEYETAQKLKELLQRDFSGRKFLLDCGHKVTFGKFLGNNVVIYNGKNPRVICSGCAYD
jgi:hypothetical protein